MKRGASTWRGMLVASRCTGLRRTRCCDHAHAWYARLACWAPLKDSKWDWCCLSHCSPRGPSLSAPQLTGCEPVASAQTWPCACQCCWLARVTGPAAPTPGIFSRRDRARQRCCTRPTNARQYHVQPRHRRLHTRHCCSCKLSLPQWSPCLCHPWLTALPFSRRICVPRPYSTISMTAVQRTGWFEWDATVSSLSTEQTGAHEWAGPVTPATRIERAFHLGISPPVPCTCDDHTAPATALLTAVTVTKLCRLSASPTQPQVASCLASAIGPCATSGQLLAGAYGIDEVGTRWVQRVEWARGFAEFKAGGKRKRNCPSVRAGDTLATIHLADGVALRVNAHVAGKLVEVNPLLETCPDLAVLDVRDLHRR